MRILIVKAFVIFYVFSLLGCSSHSNRTSDSCDESNNENETLITPIDTIINTVYLNIPMSLTKNDCESYFNRLNKDSLITDGWFISDFKRANDFEQLKAGISFATSEYSFSSNFALKDEGEKYKTIETRSSIFFYKNYFLALEIPLLTNDFSNVLALYKSKYGEPQILNKELDISTGKLDVHEFDYSPYDADRLVTWKEDATATLTEWFFLNSSIKLIYSRYKHVHEYIKLNEYGKNSKYETDCSYIYVFYVNQNIIKMRDNDIKMERDSLNAEKERELQRQNIEERIKNKKSEDLYNNQSI